MTLTEDQVLAWAALAEKATPGPWTPSTDKASDVVLWGPKESWLANIGNWARQNQPIDENTAARQYVELRDSDDAVFISSARTAVPALCAEVLAQREEIGRLRALLLESKREHNSCEDPWFSCPHSQDGCIDGGAGRDCNCGADYWNAKVDAALAGAK